MQNNFKRVSNGALKYATKYLNCGNPKDLFQY